MKNLMRTTFFLLLLGSVAVSAQQKLSIFVDSIVFATSIESKQPVGNTAEFDATTVKVYCWTKISAQDLPATIKHVWYKNDKKVFELPLLVNYPSSRIWSNKSISSGQWKVEIQNESGTVLASKQFNVK